MAQHTAKGKNRLASTATRHSGPSAGPLQPPPHAIPQKTHSSGAPRAAEPVEAAAVSHFATKRPEMPRNDTHLCAGADLAHYGRQIIATVDIKSNSICRLGSNSMCVSFLRIWGPFSAFSRILNVTIVTARMRRF